MTGRGKGFKALGKEGAKRHRKVLRVNIQGHSSSGSTWWGQAYFRLYLRRNLRCTEGVPRKIRDAVTYTEHAKRKTITTMDVVVYAPSVTRASVPPLDAASLRATPGAGEGIGCDTKDRQQTNQTKEDTSYML
ncbi:histone H4-like [Ochlerotatus camptorhynchus]|uniref:histone H4-like n=1 Tax=Ochlerotatus camptorhynchus TaxID=644619 RepID=UPI0031E3C6C8